MTEHLNGAVTAAILAEDCRRTAALLADAAALGRAIAVAEVVRLAGSQTAAAQLLGLSQPTIAILTAKARGAMDPAAFDVIEVGDDNGDYDQDAHGKLAVQRDGEWIVFAASLHEAAALIARDTGVGIELAETHNYFSGRRWIVA